MEQKITVRSNQNLIDIAILQTGGVEGVIGLILKSSLSITADLLPGTVFLYEPSLKAQTQVKRIEAVEPERERWAIAIVNQSILDIAIQEGGNVDAVVALMLTNTICITDDLQPGTAIKCPKPDGPNALREAIKVRGIRPATAVTQGNFEPLEGIDYWSVEYDFKVS